LKTLTLQVNVCDHCGSTLGTETDCVVCGLHGCYDCISHSIIGFLCNNCGFIFINDYERLIRKSEQGKRNRLHKDLEKFSLAKREEIRKLMIAERKGAPA
jgi:hypothetical protein